jgi:hypothetical protein
MEDVSGVILFKLKALGLFAKSPIEQLPVQ